MARARPEPARVVPAPDPVPVPEAAPFLPDDAPLETDLVEMNPRSLTLLADTENARYMDQEQFAQLVANLKRDGRLTSSVLVYPEADRTVVLSGNHRVKAAIEAELPLIRCEIIRSRLSAERRLALQLSHNAIVGKDDPALLHKLYADLPLQFKEYSGLSDDMFKDMDLSLKGLSIRAPQLEEVLLLFLPEDAKLVPEKLAEVGKRGKLFATVCASIENFDTFLQTLSRVKAQTNIHNSAIAFDIMLQFAMERLSQLEAEAANGKNDQT